MARSPPTVVTAPCRDAATGVDLPRVGSRWNRARTRAVARDSLSVVAEAVTNTVVNIFETQLFSRLRAVAVVIRAGDPAALEVYFAQEYGIRRGCRAVAMRRVCGLLGERVVPA